MTSSLTTTPNPLPLMVSLVIEAFTVLIVSLITTSPTRGLTLIVIPTDVTHEAQFVPQPTTDILLVIPWTILIVTPHDPWSSAPTATDVVTQRSGATPISGS